MLYPCSNAHGDNMDTHVGQCLLEQNAHAIQHHICLFILMNSISGSKS